MTADEHPIAQLMQMQQACEVTTDALPERSSSSLPSSQKMCSGDQMQGQQHLKPV